MKRSELRGLVKELNELVGCEPALDAEQDFDQAKADIIEVAGLMAKGTAEKLSDENQELLKHILKKAAKSGAVDPGKETNKKEESVSSKKTKKEEVKAPVAPTKGKVVKPAVKGGKVVKGEAKQPRATVAAVIRAGIEAKKDTETILKEVKKAFPAANTSPACVAYYRSKAKAAAKG